MRRIEKNRASARTGSQEQLHIVQIRPELVILSKLAGDHAGAAPLNIRAVGREVRTENQHLIARIKEGSKKNCSKSFAPGPTNTFSEVIRSLNFWRLFWA